MVEISTDWKRRWTIFTSKYPSILVKIPVTFKTQLIRVSVSHPKFFPQTWYRAGYLKGIYSQPRRSIFFNKRINLEAQLVYIPAIAPYLLEFDPVWWLPKGTMIIFHEFTGELTEADLIKLSLN
jgi:hypothetical protein